MRKKAAKKRVLLPDPKFNDQLVTRFVNNLMLDGKKSVAYKIFYDAMLIIEDRNQESEKNCTRSLERGIIECDATGGSQVETSWRSHVSNTDADKTRQKSINGY